MYSVSTSRTFVAQHYLTVPDPGPEGQVHSHTFTVEATFRGSELNEFGYLVDIDQVVDAMEATTERFQDETLNDLPAFEGLNPSVEHLARIFATDLLDRLHPEDAKELVVGIDEDDTATVAYRTEI